MDNYIGDITALIICKLIFYCLVDFHTSTGRPVSMIVK